MKLVLGSNSPRRVELLTQMGYSFEQRISHVDETFNDHTPWFEVPEEIALRKMQALQKDLHQDELLICADTLVFIHKKALGKPVNQTEARNMLRHLSGRKHTVITGVCLATKQIHQSFSEHSTITFDDLSDSDIDAYVSSNVPMDRAGAYGIQDWIGLIGVKEIHGSYTNVLGLPTHRLYQELKKFDP